MKAKRSLRYTLFAIALSVMAWGGICIAAEQRNDDPSQDATYLQLKAKDINSLTPREYEVLKQKEEVINQYRLAKINTKATDEMAKSSSRATTWYILLGLVSIGLLIAAM